jgi:hypothetical protein
MFFEQRSRFGKRALFPNEIIPNIKMPNPENGENPERKNPENGILFGILLVPFPLT